ncbi:L-2-amino-thiazoline-4-carboxylic acid hydrolase [Lacrimispora sp. 38-1]|uniref:L-2-amino-thiazoline-4-carboxylic acid hydrolase n=1 Tax=Lacrimispora sp. 38-1 TaxID=3125778 RepID=UPI003CE6C3C7
MMLYGLIYHIGMIRSHGAMVKRYGKDYTMRFTATSDRYFKQVSKKTPDIGKSVFSFNYAFAPAYIAWYKTAVELGTNDNNIQDLLWLMNEKIITAIPSFFRKACGRMYLNSFRKKAPMHEKREMQGKVHTYDFLIHFIPKGKSHFGIDITRCGLRTIAADFDALGIFPAVCRVDYMIGEYLHLGFIRTKTLGDGDDCCNCRYEIGGMCRWAPEEGFENRK